MQDEELAVPADSCETTGENEGDTGDKSSQTTPNLSQNTPRKKMLRNLLQRKRREIPTLKSLQFANLISGTTSKLDNANTAFQLLKGVISQNLLDFLQKQVTRSVNRKKGRYDNASKAWALTLYHISGNRGGSRKNCDIRIYDHAHLTTPKFLLCNPEMVLGFNRK